MLVLEKIAQAFLSIIKNINKHNLNGQIKYFLQELGTSGAEKLRILNTVTTQFTCSKLRFESKMCDSMLITKLLFWMQCYAIPSAPLHLYVIQPLFVPFSTQNGYFIQAGFLTDPPPLYLSILHPICQAPSLTLWTCFSYSSLCQSLPPFSTSSKPAHLLISGSCPLPSIKSYWTIRTFIHSFKNYLTPTMYETRLLALG